MPANLHLAFQVLSQFQQKYSTLPKPWDQADAEKFYQLTVELNCKVPNEPVTDELNRHWIELFAKTCTGDLCPMQTIVGSITALEIIKVERHFVHQSILYRCRP